MSTIRLTLPDGSVREVAAGTTSRAVAQSIGAGLARAALAARVDGNLRDLDRPLTADARFAIVTDKDPDALALLRHSAAHILATAVRELYPTAAIGFGPSIEDGFYYDFGVERPFTPEDLEQIEQRMAEVATRDFAPWAGPTRANRAPWRWSATPNLPLPATKVARTPHHPRTAIPVAAPPRAQGASCQPHPFRSGSTAKHQASSESRAPAPPAIHDPQTAWKTQANGLAHSGYQQNEST